MNLFVGNYYQDLLNDRITVAMIRAIDIFSLAIGIKRIQTLSL